MLLKVLLDIYIWPLLITTLLALIFRKNFGKPPLGYLPYYLIYISIVVIVGTTIMYTPIKYNIWWYNIMLNGEKFFYFYLYYTLIQNKTIKKILLILFSIYVVYFCVNYFILTDDWNIRQSMPFAVANNTIILAVFWYLIEFFKTDKVLKMFNHLIVWISFGILFYLIIGMPTMVSDFYTNRIEYIKNKKLFEALIYMQIFASMTLYFFFSIGILWTSRLKNNE